MFDMLHWETRPPRFEAYQEFLRSYFTPDGHGMRKAFLRAPLAIEHVSARDFVLDPDASATRRNYLVYPVARADGRDATDVAWTFRYADLDTP